MDSWVRLAVLNRVAVAEVLRNGTIRKRSTLESIARLTWPDDVPNEVGEDPWCAAARDTQDAAAGPTPVYLSAYWFSRALGGRSLTPERLLMFSFHDVYEATRKSSIPDDAWHLVERRLPWAMPWLQWDRCDRIRTAVVRTFLERELSPDAFGRLTESDDTFAALVSTARPTERGRAFLRRVQAALQQERDQETYAGRLALLAGL